MKTVMNNLSRLFACLLLSVIGIVGVHGADMVNGLWVSDAPGIDYADGTVW